MSAKAIRRSPPFERVPTLVPENFQIYETGMITRYVDEAFPDPRLRPTLAISPPTVTVLYSLFASRKDGGRPVGSAIPFSAPATNV